METCSFYDISCWLAWCTDEAQQFFLWALNELLSSLAFVYESIPVPEFLQGVGSFSLPSSVLWAAELFQIPTGISIMVSAYTARFILRRIPGIG